MSLLDPQHILATFGALAIFVVLVAETGLLVGIVLPGDSLLFTAGLLCATTRASTHLSLPVVLISSVAGALVGAQVGYYLGRRAGHTFLDPARRPRLQDATDRTRHFLEQYGPARAIVLARFVPVVRTLINPLAGIVEVPARLFTIAQVVGGLVWTIGVVLAGWALGSRIPNIDTYLLPIIAVIVALSLIPVAVEIVKARRRREVRSAA